MATFFGSDAYCLDDLQLIDTLVTDPNILVCQRVARRLQVPRGALGLINDDPDGGLDVRQFVNARLTTTQIQAAEAQIKAEVLKDEEVESATVKVTLSNQSGALSISIAMTSATGPFLLTLSVNDLTVQAVFSFGNQQANP